jgi:hypothetical protein
VSTSQSLPMVYLIRHGQTAWSVSGQHTGLTDLPLTANGEAASRLLGTRLRKIAFSQVFTSPLRRARATRTIWRAFRSMRPSMTTWWSGTTASMKGFEALKSRRPDRDGMSFGMGARGAKRQRTCSLGRSESLGGYARSMAPPQLFLVGTFSGFWPQAGSGSMLVLEDCGCSTRRV